MNTAFTIEQAYELLKQYNKDPFHLRHGRTVEGVMRYFARELGYGQEENFWAVVGLLHDLDFEQYPQEHCIREQQLMQDAGLEPEVIHAAVSHGYGLCCDIKPAYDGKGAVCDRRAQRPDWCGGIDAPLQEHQGFGAFLAQEKV